MNDHNELKRDLREYEVLKECARPDIYRINAFRVTGLAVDSSAMDISRQYEKVKMARQFAASVSVMKCPLPLDPPPNDDDLRAAMQRMHDPERRLVDELFWFWPQQLGRGKDDDILTTLASGEVAKALTLWLKQESYTDSNVSMHNNAILYHLTALDLEENNATLSSEQMIERDVCWVEALARWKVLVDYTYFWERLKNRVRDYGDPRLTSGVVMRLREYLPIALLTINARLAASAAECGNVQDARRHLLIIQQSGFDVNVSLGAIKCAIEPYLRRIKVLCKSAEEESLKKRNESHLLIKTYLANVEPLLNVIKCLLDKGDPTYDGIHDEVVNCVMDALVVYANATSDWDTCLELIETIATYDVGHSTKSRIDESKHIVQGNIDHKIKYETCFFCKTNPPQDEYVTEVKMYGDVSRNGSQIEWRKLALKVPRCKMCHGAHNRVGSYQGIGALLGAGLGILLTIIVVSSGGIKDDNAFVIGLVLVIGGAVAGLVFGGRKADSIIRKIGSVPLWRRTCFPDVLEMKARGWEIGEAPPNVQQ